MRRAPLSSWLSGSESTSSLLRRLVFRSQEAAATRSALFCLGICFGIVGQGAVFLARIGEFSAGIECVRVGSSLRHGERRVGSDHGELGLGLLPFIAQRKAEKDMAIELGRFVQAPRHLVGPGQGQLKVCVRQRWGRLRVRGAP